MSPCLLAVCLHLCAFIGHKWGIFLLERQSSRFFFFCGRWKKKKIWRFWVWGFLTVECRPAGGEGTGERRQAAQPDEPINRPRETADWGEKPPVLPHSSTVLLLLWYELWVYRTGKMPLLVWVFWDFYFFCVCAQVHVYMRTCVFMCMT